jgi:two-component system, OmpR family, phosphate regulon sensor histidine kinase PhoR
MGDESVIWNYLRSTVWPGLASLVLGVGLVAWRGPNPAWSILGVALLVAGITAVLTARSRPNLVSTLSAANEGTRVGLPPLAREVFERLPDPLMLLDANGRVLFANSAMRTVLAPPVASRPPSSSRCPFPSSVTIRLMSRARRRSHPLRRFSCTT